MLGEKEVYIDKNGRLENPEVFKAICNGFHIDLRDIKDEEGGSKIIDIWDINQKVDGKQSCIE